MASGDDSGQRPRRSEIGEAQERAIARLSDAFAHDRLGVDEFEQRLTLLHRATSLADVARTLSGLADDASAIEPLPGATAIVTAREVDLVAAETVAAIFGGVERRGPWRVPRRLGVVATMGGVVLDFRDAVLGPGVTELHVRAVFGGIQILVPPTLAVEVSGAAIFGGFGHVDRAPLERDPSRPMLRVRGVAIFGGVSVETRLPGESEEDAHRHRHHRHRLGGRGAPPRLPERT
jgi:hypothetical protein